MGFHLFLNNSNSMMKLYFHFISFNFLRIELLVALLFFSVFLQLPFFQLQNFSLKKKTKTQNVALSELHVSQLFAIQFYLLAGAKKKDIVSGVCHLVGVCMSHKILLNPTICRAITNGINALRKITSKFMSHIHTLCQLTVCFNIIIIFFVLLACHMCSRVSEIKLKLESVQAAQHTDI